jgi:hypothetical protein
VLTNEFLVAGSLISHWVHLLVHQQCRSEVRYECSLHEHLNAVSVFPGFAGVLEGGRVQDRGDEEDREQGEVKAALGVAQEGGKEEG